MQLAKRSVDLEEKHNVCEAAYALQAFVLPGPTGRPSGIDATHANSEKINKSREVLASSSLGFSFKLWFFLLNMVNFIKKNYGRRNEEFRWNRTSARFNVDGMAKVKI